MQIEPDNLPDTWHKPTAEQYAADLIKLKKYLKIPALPENNRVLTWDAKELNFIKHKTGDEKLLAEEDDRKFIRHILELRRTYLRHLPNPGTKDKEELAEVEQSLKELKEEVKK